MVVVGDSPRNPGDLYALWKSRQRDRRTAARHTLQNQMVATYNYRLPPEYARLFPANTPQYRLNPIRRSWDDFVTMGGKEMPPYMQPPSDSIESNDLAERIVKIAYGWHGAGARIRRGPSMKGIMRMLVWWLTGTAHAVMGVVPDYRHKTPYYIVKDPRQYFGPNGYEPWGPVPLDEVLFVRKTTLGQLRSKYPDKVAQLNAAFNGAGYTSHGEDAPDDIEVDVGEFFAKDAWFFSTMSADNKSVTLLESHAGMDRNHPGVCPWVELALYNPEGPRPWMIDQIGVDAALGRVLSQEIAYIDQILHGPIVTTGFEHKDFRSGPQGVNILDTTKTPNPDAKRLAPQTQINADRMASMFMAILRTETRNPESMQGGGDAVSSRAIESLKSGPGETLQEYIWPAITEALPTSYQIAAIEECNIWGDESKSVAIEVLEPSNPAKRGAGYVKYTPNRHLRGNESMIRVEPGLGLASYQDEVAVQQRLGSKTISLLTALERFPDIPDAQGEWRRIQGDQVRDMILAAATQNGMLLNLATLAKIAKAVEEGDNIYDEIIKADEEGRLMAQSQPPAGPGGAPGGPPLDPAMIAQMGDSLMAGGMPGPEGPPPLVGAF